ncbi:MAG: cobalamin biosynthesis protein CbiD [Lachnospiraceae bacterium]|nr:cobalamin biosynthesis protein CbiD [Lachnospiraceae bacterium]
MDGTGIEAYYALKDGKKLAFGYTTGTCAAGAAKAATQLLLTGQAPERARILTPKGIELSLPVLDASSGEGWASCAVRKYSGDDPDVTDGMLIYARATLSSGEEIRIDGGEGIGRVTKPGLKLPVGEAAINPVPREMIRRAVLEVMEECGRTGGLSVTVSIPGGEEIAKKTFNPRLGIEGGLSVLGTSGIVEPMSEEALLASIELEIRQKRALGEEVLFLAPGNIGADLARSVLGVRDEAIVKCSNFVGRALDMAMAAGFPEVIVCGHVGKLIKLAGGLMNTHSKEGDCRAEILSACALRAGGGADLARSVLDAVTTEEMLRLISEAGLLSETVKIMGEKIGFYLSQRVKGEIRTGAVVSGGPFGILCGAGCAEEWLLKNKGVEIWSIS